METNEQAGTCSPKLRGASILASLIFQGVEAPALARPRAKDPMGRVTRALEAATLQREALNGKASP